MWLIGSQLTLEEREAVIAFPKEAITPDLSTNNKCQYITPFVPNLTQPSWNGFGNGIDNARFQSETSLNASNVRKLKLKWVFGIGDTETAYGQPTIIGDRLFFGAGDGTVYSLDRQTGCTIWAYHATTSVRTAVTVQKVGERSLAFFGDQVGNVYAVDAETGKGVWQVRPEEHRATKITGAPQFYKSRLYVGFSSAEDVAAGFLKYPCCTFRGSVVALDSATGKQIWKTYTIAEKPHFIKKREDGVDMFGPAGAGVWGAPAIDPKRNALYVGTGNCYVVPAADTCDSVLALNLDTGQMNWHFQATPNDAFNLSCPLLEHEASDREKKSETCSNSPLDVDMAQAMILGKLTDGRDILIAGQKSGDIWGLDPDNQGKVIWRTKFGGTRWGSAIDQENVYVGSFDRMINDTGKKLRAPGLAAIRIADGKKVWRALAPEPTCRSFNGCHAAFDSSVTLIWGVLFAGSRDGHLRAYSTKDASIIWDFDALQEFETVNGVKAHGGSFGGASGPTIVGDMLYVGSGYGSLSRIPGNALLAFEIQP
jgi:polyvinyl alcohol dehydrogenase (cytochrome)